MSVKNGSVPMWLTRLLIVAAFGLAWLAYTQAAAADRKATVYAATEEVRYEALLREIEQVRRDVAWLRRRAEAKEEQ